MKRAHRRWHRRMGWVLVPVLVFLLSLIGLARTAPPDNAALPPPLGGALPVEGR